MVCVATFKSIITLSDLLMYRSLLTQAVA